MTICTCNARTLASEASIEDLMMQATQISDVIGLTETRRHRSLNIVFDIREELFLENATVEKLVESVSSSTRLAMKIDTFKQLTIRIGRLQLERCGSTPALTVIVAYAPTSSYDEKETEAFYMDLEKSSKRNIPSTRSSLATSTPRLAPEQLLENFTSGDPRTTMERTWGKASEFIIATKTVHGNLHFQKPPPLRWTWELPGGHRQSKVLPDRHRCCSEVLQGIGPSAPSRKVLLLAKRRTSRQIQKVKHQATINWKLFTSLAGFWEAIDNRQHRRGI